MTAEQFCYWLQGYMELSGEGAALTPEQTKMVREHLALVFHKVTPPLASPAAAPEITRLPAPEERWRGQDQARMNQQAQLAGQLLGLGRSYC